MAHVKSLSADLAEADFFFINSDLETLGHIKTLGDESKVLHLDLMYFRIIFLSVVPEVVMTTGLVFCLPTAPCLIRFLDFPRSFAAL